MPKRIKAEVIAKPEVTQISRVEVMQLNENELLPKSQDDFLRELPVDRTECFKIMAADLFYAQKQNALRMWHIGKIIHTLNGRGEENVMEEAMQLTQFKERALAYCVAVFKEFPNPQHISNLGKLLNWTSIRGLLKVHNKDNRESLCERVMAGELTDSNLDTAVKAAVAEERKDAKEAEDTEPVGPPTKKLNHAAIMAKVENYMLETTKRIQQYEVELVETFRNVWNRELVQDEAVFDDCIKAFENVETSATKLKEIVAKFVKTTKNASETDPFK